MARIDELRLMAKVARMYYQQDLTQNEIMRRLSIHQSTVSRILKRAEKEGIVRVIVSMPSGTHPELEESLQARYSLEDAVVVDCVDDEDQIVRDLGAAAAFTVESTLKASDVIGISCWSAALLAMVDAMHPTQRAAGTRVVQILGGVGSPGGATYATSMTRRFANLISAEASLLPAPGVVGSPETRQVLLKDPYVQDALKLFKSMTVALVGIGSVEPSRMLAASGNIFAKQELDELTRKGAVGDICLRFFDATGEPVITPLNDRVISLELADLRRVPRVIGVAGGGRKTAAIRGALRGGWIKTLITDRMTAERLLEPEPAQRARGSRRGARSDPNS